MLLLFHQCGGIRQLSLFTSELGSDIPKKPYHPGCYSVQLSFSAIPCDIHDAFQPLLIGYCYCQLAIIPFNPISDWLSSLGKYFQFSNSLISKISLTQCFTNRLHSFLFLNQQRTVLLSLHSVLPSIFLCLPKALTTF